MKPRADGYDDCDDDCIDDDDCILWEGREDDVAIDHGATSRVGQDDRR